MRSATWPRGTLGRAVVDMYDERGFALPGTDQGASPYLAQHDFAHVLADYGTNLKGELEVFAFVGRADPDPKGFAWLATLIGLFDTGYVADTGFFERDVQERSLQAPGMQHRVADAIAREAGRRALRHRSVRGRLPRARRPAGRRGARGPRDPPNRMAASSAKGRKLGRLSQIRMNRRLRSQSGSSSYASRPWRTVKLLAK